MKAMSKLVEIAKPSTFLLLRPDARIPTPQAARNNENNIIHTPRVVPEGQFSYTLPEPRQQYVYFTSNDNAVRDLGLDAQEVQSQAYQDIVSGAAWNDEETAAKLPPPWSQAYAGYQFGQFAGQLGDGRVCNLFEVDKPLSVPEGVLTNRRRYELQLKGSGKTPYLRFADGKAVLRLSIREYIISEAIHALGIPLTRALLLTYLPKTYGQRLRAEKCAVVCRFAESWVRLGTFDLCRYRGDREGVRNLSAYVMDTLFEGKFVEWSKVASRFKELPLSRYDQMYYEIIARNARTTALWQVYGFLNGVLNTDNTLVLGLSMDFGPFLIMDKFNPNYTPNSEDHDLRYSYKNTPTAIWWNLTRLGEDLAELLGAGPEHCDDPAFDAKQHEDEIITRATRVIQQGGEVFEHAFTKAYVQGFFDRLGLSHALIDDTDISRYNKEFISPLLSLLFKLQCDYNNFFLVLQQHYPVSDPATVAGSLVGDVDGLSPAEEALLRSQAQEWLEQYATLIAESKRQTGFDNQLHRYNPVFLPRNWILQQVIDITEESQGDDLRYLKKLERMSSNPYDRSKWGDDLRDIEQKWMGTHDADEQTNLQCSCSS